MLLFDTFLEKIQRTASGILKRVNDPMLRSGLGAITQAGHLSDKIIFGPSTMLMLIDKLAHFEETAQEVLAALGDVTIPQMRERITSLRGAWVQFDKPIDTVAAILVFIPSVYLKTGTDRQHFYLIGQDAEIVDALHCDFGDAWHYIDGLHRCPHDTREHGVLIPCETCRYKLVVWGNIMALSAIIAGQYLAAMRYEEKTVTSIRHIPRKKSTGKERRVPIKHIFKVIDANEIIIPVSSQEESLRAKEERGTWIDTDVVYEEIRTRPFTRTYRHPRYVNVRGQTVPFPEGIKRLQPKKIGNLGKVVTKVKASLYEKGGT